MINASVLTRYWVNRMARKKRDNFAKKRRVAGSFSTIPHDVQRCQNYSMLSFKAKALLLDLSSQIVYKKGDYSSNGNICAALKTMKPLGWKSADTLDAAEAELLHYGFLEVTQPGNRRNPTLYAVSWEAISPVEGKPWITATAQPSCKYKVEVKPLLPRRPTKKKLIPGSLSNRLIAGLWFFPIPEDWVNGYPRIGLNVQKVINLYPRIGLKHCFSTCFYTRGLVTSIDLSHRHSLKIATAYQGQHYGDHTVCVTGLSPAATTKSAENRARRTDIELTYNGHLLSATNSLPAW